MDPLRRSDSEQGDASIYRWEIEVPDGLTTLNGRYAEGGFYFPLDPVTQNVVDGEMASIGGRTYSFVDTLSTSPAVPDEIKIGATGTESMANFAAAINAEDGAGVKYGDGTVLNALVRAIPLESFLQLYAKVKGAAGNAIPLTTDSVLLTLIDPGTTDGGRDGVEGKAGDMICDGGTAYLCWKDNEIGDNFWRAWGVTT